MNKLEADYAQRLELMLRDGSLLWYGFEAIKLRLADATFYTPDFFILNRDGLLECHEVKGFWEDDARVKIKVAASMFPFRFLGVRREPKSRGGGWVFEAF